MPGQYSGRLVCDGDGNLYAHGVGTADDLGSLRRVAYDHETNGFIFIADDAPSHNDRHGRNTVDISGTTSPLYDADGNLVAEGDPHHVEPLPDDAHYDESAPNKTRLQWDPNDPNPDYEGDPTVTGHTEAR